MEIAGKIPVVEFSYCSIDKPELDFTADGTARVAKELTESMSRFGFVYLRNCGISSDLLQSAFSSSMALFRLPWEVKSKYKAALETDFTGYFAPDRSGFDHTVPPDKKEGFVFNLSAIDSPIWPSEVSPTFKNTMIGLFEECAHLSGRILKLLARGLGLDDLEFFTRHHNMLTKKDPFGPALQTSYYPALTQSTLKAGQARLGEHTDFGTITLVFQDGVGGLQVRGSDGEWIDARPIEGTVLVNIADLLEYWTSGRLVSTPHRIALPGSDWIECPDRQSLVFFVHPDPDAEIQPMDGSDQSGVLKAGEYVKRRVIAATENARYKD